MSFGSLLQDFKNVRALVIGDLMLDEYVFGRATRISQEAPVMIVKQSHTRDVPGGAGNVAGNMVALGGKVSILGVTGDDAVADRLENSLRHVGLDPSRLLPDSARTTTRKTRIVANHSHQVLRIDHEEEAPLSPAMEERLLGLAIESLAEVDVLLISDYAKGAVTPGLVVPLIDKCKSVGVRVVANPKPGGLSAYAGCYLLSLNRYEAAEALGEKFLSDEDAEGAAEKLVAKLGVECLLITLGASGIAASFGGRTARIPAILVEVYDEAGAGDTVIATVALGVGANQFGREVLELATRTAASVVQKVGVATPTLEDLERIASVQFRAPSVAG